MKNESSSRNYRYFGLQRLGAVVRVELRCTLKENPRHRDIVLERRQVAPTEFSAMHRIDLLHCNQLRFLLSRNYLLSDCNPTPCKMDWSAQCSWQSWGVRCNVGQLPGWQGAVNCPGEIYSAGGAGSTAASKTLGIPEVKTPWW